MKITLKPYREMATWHQAAYHVYVDGTRAGYISKFRDTKTTFSPWKAYGWPVNDKPNFLGDFWPALKGTPNAVCAKSAAAQAVADAFTRGSVIDLTGDAAGFVAKIKAEPTCEVNRLVFADWLEERDGPNDKEAAAWLRLDIEMTGNPYPHPQDFSEWQRGSKKYFGGAVDQLYYAIQAAKPKVTLKDLFERMLTD